MFFELSVSLHQSASAALVGRRPRNYRCSLRLASGVDGTTTRREWACNEPGIRERWRAGFGSASCAGAARISAQPPPIPVTRSISTSWIRGAIRLSKMPHGLRIRLRERPSKVLAGRNAPGQVFGSRANNQHCDSRCNSECAQCVTIRTGPSRPETGGAMPRPRPPAAAPPGPPRPACVARTSSSSSFEPAFSALVTSQR